MARFRSLRSQSPAIAIATLALVFSLGGGAGYAASTAGHAAKPAWHVLTLRNGWSKSGADQRAPSYEVAGGVVYLSGAMHQTSGSGTGFAVLPKGARPAHTLWIGVYSEATTSAFLEVTPSGAMFIGGANDMFFASLSGISFPLNS